MARHLDNTVGDAVAPYFYSSPTPFFSSRPNIPSPCGSGLWKSKSDAHHPAILFPCKGGPWKRRRDPITHHIDLTGVTGKRTTENFSRAAEHIGNRPRPTLLIANTLLVPGYIDEEEIRRIARFIASIDPCIPYSILAFYPRFFMSDLPLTTKALATRRLKAAQEEGLRNVRIGNEHLLV